MFKAIFTLSVLLCSISASRVVMAQASYAGDGFDLYWNVYPVGGDPSLNFHYVVIDAWSGNATPARVVIDFDLNKTEIEINGHDYDLQIGKHEWIWIDVCGSSADDEVDVYGTPTQARVDAYLFFGNDRFENHGSAQVTVYGNEGNDLLIGGSANDHLNGGPGEDVLLGGDGADLLDGSLDGFTDWLEGEGGEDIFVRYLYPVSRASVSSLRTSGVLSMSRTTAPNVGVREAEYQADFDADEDTVLNAYEDGHVN